MFGACGLRAAGSTAVSSSAGASVAFARVGGGSHGGSSATSHSSGSHSSGSYSGGGAGGGSFGGGIIGLIIVALILWFIVRRLRNYSAGPNLAVAPLDRGIAVERLLNAYRNPAADAVPASYDPVAAVRAADPDFELEVFLQRAEMCFFLVKRGIQKNDAPSIRPYLSDSVYAQVSGNLETMKHQHVHSLLESLNVRAVHLESATCSERDQILRVHFDLVYRAKTLDEGNRIVADEREDGRHGERWTFARAASARTPQNGGVVSSRCPACGAELRLNLDGTCAHCRASVTNGTVDWIVTEVHTAPFMGYASPASQALAAPSVAQGIAALTSADPGFSFAAFQARAAQAFMALQAAWCSQNMDGGRGFLSPGAYFAWSSQLETMTAEGRRNIMENVQVSAIEALQVVHGRVFDDLTVRISAVAADFEVDKDNQIVYGDRTVRPFREDWTFQRSVGVVTSGKPGTLESTCPSCGAPMALSQIGECRYCRAAVTSGKFDWVVSRIEQEDDQAGIEGSAQSIGGQLAAQVGGAIVGGLLGSLLSGSSSRKSDEW